MITKNEKMAKEIISIMEGSLSENLKEQSFRDLTKKEMSTEFFINILPALFKEFKNMSPSKVEPLLDKIIVNSLLSGFEISGNRNEHTEIKVKTIKEYHSYLENKNDIESSVLTEHMNSVINSISGSKFIVSQYKDTNDIYSDKKEDIAKVQNSVRRNNSGLTPEGYRYAAALIQEATLKLKDDESEQQKITDLAVKRLIESEISPMYIILMRRLIDIAGADLSTNEKMISNAINACIINNIKVVPLENIPKYEKEVFSQYNEKLLKTYASEDIQEHLGKIKDLMNFKIITNEKASTLYQKIELERKENVPQVSLNQSQKLN